MRTGERTIKILRGADDGDKPNLYLPIIILTAVFGGIFIFVPLFVRKGPNRGVIRCSTMLATFFMWILWVTVYISQMNPILAPRMSNYTLGWIVFSDRASEESPPEEAAPEAPAPEEVLPPEAPPEEASPEEGLSEQHNSRKKRLHGNDIAANTNTVSKTKKVAEIKNAITMKRTEKVEISEASKFSTVYTNSAFTTSKDGDMLTISSGTSINTSPEKKDSGRIK